MNMFAKISSTAVVVAALVAPSTVAFAEATLVTDNASASMHAVPGERFVGLLGFSKAASYIGSADVVRIIYVGDIYDSETLISVDEALIATKRSAVQSLQAGLGGGSEAGAYLVQHNIDVNNVLAIEKDGLAVNVYMSSYAN